MKKKLLIILSLFLTLHPVSVRAEEPDAFNTPEETETAEEPEAISGDVHEDSQIPVEQENSGDGETIDPAVPENGSELPEEPVTVPEETPVPEEPAEDPSDTIEETEVPEEPADTAEAPDEEAEESELFSEDEIDFSLKQKLADNDIPAELTAREAGIDYAEDEVVLIADTPDYAERAAQAYGGELIRFDGNVAVIRLPEGMSVADAVSRGMDPEEMIPAVDVNWYIRLDEPVMEEETPVQNYQLFSAPALTLPKKTDWSYWIEGLEIPDPLLEQVSYNSMDAYPWQWYHEKLGTWQAWGVSTGSPEVKVAVIDSGVQEDHEELAGKVTLRQVSDISVTPTNGHGTHVAGIIAAKLGNGKGGAGIAPDVSILSYNVFRSSTAAAADIAAAINMAADDGAWVINMSFGTVSYSTVIESAINNAYDKGCTIIAAMGNHGSNLKVYPAAMEHVISVTASRRDGARAAFSNYGDWADIAAPGSEISSSYYYYGTESGYQTLQGTSMSAPVVTGSAALYMSVYGHLSPDEMEKVLKKNLENGNLSLKKLFGNKESAPQILFDEETNRVTIEKISDDDRAVIVYTLNGKNPVVKNGTVTRGTIYADGIDLSNKPADTVITVKSLVVSGAGVPGDVASMKVMVRGPQARITDRKIKSITFAGDTLKLCYSEAEAGTGAIPVTKITLADGTTALLEDYEPEDMQWYSSNPKVAVVDENGVVTAAGKGTAYINLRIRFQNSVKTARYKVRVTRLADSIRLTGRSGVTAGSSVRVNAAVLPDTTSNKNVTWSIDSVSEPGFERFASISKKGVLTVKKEMPAGTEITVRCTAKDGSGASSLRTVTVCTAARSVRIERDGVKIRSAKLYTADLPETADTENVLSLTGIVTTSIGESEVSPIWTSSKPKVAKVDAQGNVTALKKGTTTITCIAADGSEKKATVKVTVTVPTSGIFVTVPAVNWNSSLHRNQLTLGKTCQLKAQVGKMFGKPGNSSVKWKLEEVYLNGEDRTQESKDMILVKVSGKGSVSVSASLLKKLGADSLESGYVRVSASAKDGTGHYDEAILYLCPKVKSLVMKYLSKDGEAVPVTGALSVTQNKSITIYAYMDNEPQSLRLNSADPDICGARVDRYETVGGELRAVIKVTGGTTPGAGVITVTERGSGLKRTVKINVKPAQ